MTNIIQFPVPIPVTNGNLPQFKFAIFGDNLATVTTAGYLTSAAIQSGIPLSNADVIMGLYSFNQQTQSGTFVILTVAINSSTGQITLSEWNSASGGSVTLPTTANYLTHFTNATGNMASTAGNVIQPGNISAGLAAGGTAGTLASFPATGSKGSLILAAVANTGNTNTTISNVAMGQASVVSIPDPANAIGRLLVGATATPFVSGNFPQNSGTGGLMVDSGVPVSSLATTSTAVLLAPAGDQTITAHNLTVSQGNLTAGSSGHAGTVTSFPAAASNGSLIVSAVGNAGNFNTTVSNSATQSLAQVITIPDSGLASANFILDQGTASQVTVTKISTGATPVPLVDPGSCTITAVAGAVNTATVTIQLKDGSGTNIARSIYFKVYASSAADGLTLASAASTGFSVASGGLDLSNGTAVTTQISAMSSATGGCVLSLLDTAKQTSYLVLVLPSGNKISAQLTAGSYG